MNSNIKIKRKIFRRIIWNYIRDIFDRTNITPVFFSFFNSIFNVETYSIEISRSYTDIAAAVARRRSCLLLLLTAFVEINSFEYLMWTPPPSRNSCLRRVYIRNLRILSGLLNCPLKYVHIIAIICYYFSRGHRGCSRLRSLLHFLRK